MKEVLFQGLEHIKNWRIPKKQLLKSQERTQKEFQEIFIQAIFLEFKQFRSRIKNYLSISCIFDRLLAYKLIFPRTPTNKYAEQQTKHEMDTMVNDLHTNYTIMKVASKEQTEKKIKGTLKTMRRRRREEEVT